VASSGFEASEVVPPEESGHGDRERGEALVLELVGSQADSLLRVARRYSMCADDAHDAHDAYQRGLEILMRHAARLDPERAAGWLHTVVYRHLGTLARARPKGRLSASILPRSAFALRVHAPSYRACERSHS
jgi:DNA-directed RNA polymerase specialized sigma24 family protein